MRNVSVAELTRAAERRPFAPPDDDFIAFSALVNKVALPGPGRYSYFTEALAQEIVKAQLSASEMLLNVRRTVFDKTDGRQTPVVEDQRLAKFQFALNEPSSPETVTGQSASSQLIGHWQGSARDGDCPFS